MAICLYGSQKRDGARDLINPNDIGVLCSLFGLDGALCRLLDLVPSAIKKIASLNPNVGNADQVFGDILKKVARKSLGIVIDSVTGNIETLSFCAIEAPAQPDEITFSDVFIFIAELVPILNTFFSVNDVITGESTKLLDKIVGFWLRKQWFENCECKKKPNDMQGLPDPSNIVPIPIEPPDIFCDTDSNNKRCKSLYYATNPQGIGAIFSCKGFYQFTGDNIEGYASCSDGSFKGFLTRREYFCTIETITLPDGRLVPKARRTYKGNNWDINEQCEYVSGASFSFQSYFSKDGVNFLPFNGEFPESDYPPCPPPPPPSTIPKEFCDLFPDNEFCNNSPPPPPCDIESVNLLVFDGCGKDRKSESRTLFKSGNNLSISVLIFDGCGKDRKSESRTLFDC